MSSESKLSSQQSDAEEEEDGGEETYEEGQEVEEEGEEEERCEETPEEEDVKVEWPTGVPQASDKDLAKLSHKDGVRVNLCWAFYLSSHLLLEKTNDCMDYRNIFASNANTVQKREECYFFIIPCTLQSSAVCICFPSFLSVVCCTFYGLILQEESQLFSLPGHSHERSLRSLCEIIVSLHPCSLA